ncbi:MAG TPA: pyridoxal-phosphate dependent enzyme [Myxococcota bacterium]|nr:pyridoxal-phosphate dependent enzyme [Myxococcota bacterium]
MGEPALFRRFPALRERIAHRPFLSGPTPVVQLPVAGVPDLFVKRDERCAPLYGGNKPRKLEFVLGDALERRARRVVTTGGLGTHHGLATAIYARACGLATTLVLVDQPVTDDVRESLRLFAAYGADVVDARNVRGAVVRTAAALARSFARGERPRLVPTGGSSATGNLGFVSAGCELADQVDAGLLPEPALVFAPVGSGGTVAGLAAGLRLAGLRSQVVGVLATDILPPSPASLARAARAALRRLRRADPTLRSPGFSAADFPLATGQVGPGYGAATDAAREARAVAAEAGLELDLTYSAKCFAELLARARAGALPRGPVLFWHTFNAVDPKAGAPGSWPRDALPARLRRLAEAS